MSKPIVAVVGRPNVGKSTLVNRLTTKRDAIVHESRGVTRDRSYHDCDWNGREFTLIDTGGIESLKSKDQFAASIREQAGLATQEADVIVFVVDGQVGTTNEDEEVARILQKTKKPKLLVVNKMDNPAHEGEIWDFYSLGMGEPYLISATHGYGTGDLLDEVVALFPTQSELDARDDALDAAQQADLNIAIIGRPNVGKSSLTNRLCGNKRSIVSDVAGTTRDAIDTYVTWNNHLICLVDTAGIRKKTQVHEDVEYYSMVRGLAAMERADVCLLVVDATIGVTEQDQKLAGMAIERGCGLVVVLNKYDLVNNPAEQQALEASFNTRLGFASWAPHVNTSALTGRGTDKLLKAAFMAAQARSAHLKTPELNDLLAAIRESGFTKTDKRRRLKLMYATQTGEKPPSITFWCNAPDLVDDNYERYLENRLRERFELRGTPVRFHFKKKD